MLKSALRHPILRALVVVAAMVNACTGADLRTPYTESELQIAVPMGIPAVRTWADAPLSVLRPQVAHLPILNESGQFSILALSGGGEHGAFGAGLLNGWSESGKRPTFSIVTGISTGALMAPFAFLGSAYDQRLKALYTDMSFHGILSGSPLMGFFGEGLYNTRPLQRNVDRQVDQTMLADIAAAHRQGRRLFVVTTNLDAQRPVLWNMGAIAASERPGALELFRKVLLASASVLRVRSRQWPSWRQLATSPAAPLSVSPMQLRTWNYPSASRSFSKRPCHFASSVGTRRVGFLTFPLKTATHSDVDKPNRMAPG
jgi:hypothetical protein